MAAAPEAPNPTEGQENPAPTAAEMIKVVDRQGRVKMLPRSEYEAKKRRRRRRESSAGLPLGDILSIAFIIAAIVIASYFALKLVK
jgi:hypothetical protein